MVLVEVEDVVEEGATVVVGACVVVVLLVVLSVGGSLPVSSDDEHAATRRTPAIAAATHLALTLDRWLIRMGDDSRRRLTPPPNGHAYRHICVPLIRTLPVCVDTRR